MNRCSSSISPSELRTLSAAGEFEAPTAGYCEGYAQANLVALPEEYAGDFAVFCRKNPKPCPVLEVVGAGSCTTSTLANQADLRVTLPRYRIWKHGAIHAEASNICDDYRDNLVFFLLGCSFSFESALIHAGIPLRHLEERKNVAMYDTSIPLQSAGVFQGNMVVSMRPIHYSKVVDACLITAHYPEVHGAPVHIGSPHLIGITHLQNPDYGDSVMIRDDEVPVFWACGVTPQDALARAQLPFAITHAPGYMFIGDVKNETFYKPLL